MGRILILVDRVEIQVIFGTKLGIGFKKKSVNNC